MKEGDTERRKRMKKLKFIFECCKSAEHAVISQQATKLIGKRERKGPTPQMNEF